MMKLILVLSVLALVSGCGSKGESSASQEVKGTDPITAGDGNITLGSLVGNYDLLRADTDNCGESIQIVERCEGVQVKNTNFRNESYCNVNKGEIRTGDNRSSITVSLSDKVLLSVAKIFDERAYPPGNVKQTFTSSISLDENGNLFKVAENAAGKTICLYQKAK